MHAHKKCQVDKEFEPQLERAMRDELYAYSVPALGTGDQRFCCALSREPARVGRKLEEEGDGDAVGVDHARFSSVAEVFKG